MVGEGFDFDFLQEFPVGKSGDFDYKYESLVHNAYKSLMVYCKFLISASQNSDLVKPCPESFISIPPGRSYTQSVLVKNTAKSH